MDAVSSEQKYTVGQAKPSSLSRLLSSVQSRVDFESWMEDLQGGAQAIPIAAAGVLVIVILLLVVPQIILKEG